jgi:hypothetical protein
LLQEVFLYVDCNVWWPLSFWETLYGNFCVVTPAGKLKDRRNTARTFVKNYMAKEMTVMEAINTWWTQPNPVARKHAKVLKGELLLYRASGLDSGMNG